MMVSSIFIVLSIYVSLMLWKRNSVVLVSSRMINLTNPFFCFSDGGARSAALNNALVFMIAKDRMPLSTPESVGFQHFAATAVPLWKPPSRKSLTTMMEAKYDMFKTSVKRSFAELPSLTLTWDIWTEQHTTTSFLGGSAHYQAGVEMETCTLSVTELSEAHNSEYLATVMTEVCAEWSIDTEKVTLNVTDNAGNMKNAVIQVFGSGKLAPCFDHTLNLIPKYALGRDSSW